MKLDFTSRKVPKSACPKCGEILGGVTDTSGKGIMPTPLQLSVCVYCGEFLQFQKDLTMRALTEEEIAMIRPENRSSMEEIRSLVRQEFDLSAIRFYLANKKTQSS